jgi:microcystin-dependent protein
LCDGNGGTPDLRDRFVVGAGSGYAVGTKAGRSSVTLSVDNLPSHSHTYLDGFFAEYEGNDGAFGRVQGSRSGYDNDNYIFSRTRTSNSTGGNQAFDIRPPYYALAYIMRVQ